MACPFTGRLNTNSTLAFNSEQQTKTLGFHQIKFAELISVLSFYAIEAQTIHLM